MFLFVLVTSLVLTTEGKPTNSMHGFVSRLRRKVNDQTPVDIARCDDPKSPCKCKRQLKQIGNLLYMATKCGIAKIGLSIPTGFHCAPVFQKRYIPLENSANSFNFTLVSTGCELTCTNRTNGGCSKI